MLTSALRPVTDATFDREVLASPVPVLVDFTAPWCAPCRAMTPILAALSVDHGASLRVLSADVDVEVVLATRYDVRNLPTLILFRRGAVIARIVGAVSRARLDAAIAEALAR